MFKQFSGAIKNNKLFSGSFLVSAGFGCQKIIQLASNLLLTRILYPEAFGIMVIVNVFLAGLTMMSDIGIRPAIIQAKTTSSTDFLNTAWTLQIIRGLALWLTVCLLAYPISIFYEHSLLAPILCFSGSAAMFAGLNSIGMILAERKIQLKRVVLLQFLAQATSIAVMIALSLLYNSVWSLAIGTLAGVATSTLLSHLLFKGHTHKLKLDPKYVKQLFHFGKWIFWATLFTFFSSQGIRMIEGWFVAVEVLGIISIAATLAWMVGDLFNRLIEAIFFPTLARVFHDSPDTFSATLAKMRSSALMISIPIFGALSLLSTFIISLLYDDRYHDAGPFLAILAINGLVRVLPTFYQKALQAQGNTRVHFHISGLLAIFSTAGVVLGFKFFGVFGMFIGSGVGLLLAHVYASVIAYKQGWFSAKFEGLLALSIGLMIAATYAVNF